MTTVFHPADSRGNVDLGWLNSHHSFSFGHWYNPEKIHFGALRVLNDDIVRGGAGFGTHPHDNMEIVSIPLSGALAHKDSTGTDGIINTGDVQIMSAGSGISHSEYNASKTEAVNFLQIWIFPKEKNITPRYDQKAYNPANRVNKWQVVVGNREAEDGLWINQDARFSRATLEAGKSLDYTLGGKDRGVYLFVIDGSVSVNGQELNRRDALGVSDTDQLSIQAGTKAELLAIEVPMHLS